MGSKEVVFLLLMVLANIGSGSNFEEPLALLPNKTSSDEQFCVLQLVAQARTPTPLFLTWKVVTRLEETSVGKIPQVPSLSTLYLSPGYSIPLEVGINHLEIQIAWHALEAATKEVSTMEDMFGERHPWLMDAYKMYLIADGGKKMLNQAGYVSLEIQRQNQHQIQGHAIFQSLLNPAKFNKVPFHNVSIHENGLILVFELPKQNIELRTKLKQLADEVSKSGPETFNTRGGNASITQESELNFRSRGQPLEETYEGRDTEIRLKTEPYSHTRLSLEEFIEETRLHSSASELTNEIISTLTGESFDGAPMEGFSIQAWRSTREYPFVRVLKYSLEVYNRVTGFSSSAAFKLEWALSQEYFK